ncbi:MAG: 4'-phosphopantetheinyl transferase superfamily protein [Deltaproteobacteria bacterium]|nr:4'-phosphopantetheinyl transferase superfamily protein [Deltaproteobacteria bacterium]
MTVFFLECRAGDVPLDDRWLGPRERGLCSALRLEKRRRDWRLGRWTAKQALRRFQARTSDSPSPMPLDATELLPAPDGAPEFHGLSEPSSVQVSISHRGDVAVCAIAAHPLEVGIGCDLESVETRSEGLVDDFFTGREREAVARVPSTSKDPLVALIWSAKESALKVLRCGLRRDTRSVEVSVPDFERLLEQPATRASENFHHFEVQDLGEGARFVGWWRCQDAQILTIAVRCPGGTRSEDMSPPIDLR